MLNNIKIEKIFVYLAVIFGFIFIMIIPPFQSPDEDSHFKKAYVVSRGDFFPIEKDNKLGYYLSDDMVNYIDGKLEYAGKLDKKYSFKEMYFDERLPKDYTKKSFYNFTTVMVNPIAYIAPTTGILVGKAFLPILKISNNNQSVVYMLYFARIFSLIMYIVLIYFAIKTTPILKKTFGMIGLIPMSLSLASCISYDNFLIPLSLLLSAIIFKLTYDDEVKNINKKYIIAIIVIGFILLNVKIVYATLLLLLFMIPKEKWGSKKSNRLIRIAMVFGFIVGLTIIFKIPYYFLSAKDANSEFYSEQLSYILNNPFNYLMVFMRTIKNAFYFYLSGMIGTFGLIDTNILSPFVLFYFILFMLTGISEISLLNKKIPLFSKALVAISVVGSIFGIFTAMYIVWTSILPGYGIGAPIISGVQGRYFIPLLAVSFIIFGNKVIVKNKYLKKGAETLVTNSYFISTILLIITTITIIFRYWC